MKSSTISKKIIALFVLILICATVYRYASGNSFAANYMSKIQKKGMGVEEFQKKVSRSKLVLVYFNAAWCMPCIKLKPEINELEKEIKDYCNVLQINTDDNPAIAEYYEINSLPMFVIYINGKKVWENIGSLSKTQLKSKIDLYTK